MKCHYTAIKMAKIKTTDLVSFYKDVEELELSYITNGNETRAIILENSLVIS